MCYPTFGALSLIIRATPSDLDVLNTFFPCLTGYWVGVMTNLLLAIQIETVSSVPRGALDSYLDSLGSRVQSLNDIYFFLMNTTLVSKELETSVNFITVCDLLIVNQVFFHVQNSENQVQYLSRST